MEQAKACRWIWALVSSKYFSLTPRAKANMAEGWLYFVERNGSFDEVYVCGETTEGLWLCKCHLPENKQWRWVLVDMVPGHFRSLVDHTVERSADVEAGGRRVNYLMAVDSEGTLQTKWDPEDHDGRDQVNAWMAEAQEICRWPLPEYDHFVAGSRAARLPEFKRKGRKPPGAVGAAPWGLPPCARRLPRPALPFEPRGAGTGLGEEEDVADDDDDPDDAKRMLEAH